MDGLCFCSPPPRMHNSPLLQSCRSWLLLLKQYVQSHAFIFLRWDGLSKTSIKYFLWLMKMYFGSAYCSREFCRVLFGWVLFCLCCFLLVWFFKNNVVFFPRWQFLVLPYQICTLSFSDSFLLFKQLICCRLLTDWKNKTRLHNEHLSHSFQFKSPYVRGLAQCYFFDVTNLNPCAGRLYQVEYAMEAIGHAGTCLGILANDGVLLAAERRNIHKLLDEVFFSEKIYKLNE